MKSILTRKSSILTHSNRCEKTRSPRPPCRLSVEPLENRFTPAVFLQDSTLNINGSALNDYATVWESGSGSNVLVNVNLNGIVSIFPKLALPKGIVFRGYGGDDFFHSTANVAVWATGGAGNDRLESGPGADHLYGNSGNDSLLAGAGKDYLDGGTGHDTMFGGSNNDTLRGRDGNDRLYGEGGGDTLYGDNHNDQLFGGDGADKLYGNKHNDDLYGHDGSDTLNGGSGADGLCGGFGSDDIHGGSGADRFLNIIEPFDVQFDEVQDFNDDLDANVYFGYGAKDWTYDEIEAVDTALAVLHLHPLTQHTELLKHPDGHAIVFSRADAPVAAPEGYDIDPNAIGAWAVYGDEPTEWSNYRITVYDYAFTVGIMSTIVEVIGTAWAEASVNDQWDAFTGVSGWTQELDPYGPALQAAQGGWYYRADASFASDLARTNPVQDWAATFSYFFLSGSMHPDANVQLKLNMVGTFLFDLD